MHTALRSAAGLTVTAAVLALAACSGGSAPAESAAPAPEAQSDGTWPRTVVHAAGETEIPAEPIRILSTSPSITGSLLALQAPLGATAATSVSGLTDGKGLFSQWAEVADERGVEIVYGNLELDLDAVDAFGPDLIIGSANGGDSVLEAYDQLSDIAPTVLLDYGTVTWQELTVELGDILGLEDRATAVIAEYDGWVKEQATRIAVPAQPTTALVYLGADGVWAFTGDTPQASLLASLGFEYIDVPAEVASVGQGGRSGVAMVSAENMPAAFAGSQTLFVVPISAAADAEVAGFATDPLLSTAPAVTGDRVFSLGSAAFRLDYFSAKDTVELLVSEFGK